MRNEREMKTLRTYLALLVAAAAAVSHSGAQIIGSSVVTSVSVVLGDEATSEPTPFPAPSSTSSTAPSTTTTTTSSPSTIYTGRPTPPTFPTTTTTGSTSTFSPAKLKAAEDELAEITSHSTKSESGFGDVSSVIASLKNIVEIESQKHHQGGGEGKSELAYDGVDDEVEDDQPPPPQLHHTSKHRLTTLEPTAASMRSTTTTVSNVTATSAEVHEAIHRISGELLTPGKPSRKPIENILTDVLTSINESRNLTGPGAALVPKSKLVNKGGSGGGTKQTPKPSPKPSLVKKQPLQAPGKKNTATVIITTTKKPKVTAKPSQAQSQSQPRPQTNNKTTSPPKTSAASSASTTNPKATPSSTTSKPLSTTKPVYKGPSTTAEPQIGFNVKGSHKVPGLPTDDNLTQENETEEEFGIGGVGNAKDDFAPFPSLKRGTTVKPVRHPPTVAASQQRPSRPQIVYINTQGDAVQTSHLHPIQMRPHGSNKRKNGTLFGNRPTEFYDDEIFGYDPYQTFLHGVYIPEVELGAASPQHMQQQLQMQQQQQYAPESTMDDFQFKTRPRPQPMAPVLPYLPLPPTRSPAPAPNPFFGYQQTAQTPSKPVPNLPDYLHRPRPSHLQYQHAVAETVDTETGLVTITVPHPDDPHQDEKDIIGSEPSASLPMPRPVASAQAHAPLPSTQPQPTKAPSPPKQTQKPPRPNPNPSGPPPPDVAAVGMGDVGNDDPYGSAHYDYNLHYHHQNFEQTHGPIEKRPTFAKAPVGNPGLETTVTNLDTEMRGFVDLNNRLALRLLSSVTNPVSKASPSYGNLVLSPFTITSSLGMLFLGARGGTAAQLDGLLQLDDMLTFNPHLLYYNVTQSFLSQPNTAAAIIRLLIADKSKGDVLEFFKTRVQHFYDTRVEEADYKFAGHLAQSIINQMIRAQIQRHSYEMLNSSLPLKGPMSLLTAAFFDGQFGGIRDSSIQDMNFVQLGSMSRRLVQIPAVAITGPHRSVYDTELDATAVEVPYTTRDLSLILIMPGRPGEFGLGGVQSLKSRLTLETWTTLTRGFYARSPFKFVFPRFRHHSALNISYTLQRFGLTDMFVPHLAKFKGVNGLNDLHLDQNAMHFSEFGTTEKLSDTLNEGTYNAQHGHHYPSAMPLTPVAGHKKFDLVRILRPHVREQYGNYGEPISVGDWLFHHHSHNSHPAPRFGATGGPSEYSQAYQPFQAYSRMRSGRTPAGVNLSQLFTRDSKTGKRKQGQGAHGSAAGGSSSDGEEQVLRFERPFLYVLRHAPTGMILMCGQYTDPVTSTD